MEKICSKWRKPVKRPSKKRKLAALKAKARWNKMQTGSNLLASISESDELSQDISHEMSDVTGEEESASFCGNKSDNSEVSVLSQSTRTEKKLSYVNNTYVEQDLQGSAYSFVHDSMWSDLLKNLTCEQCGKKQLFVKNVSELGYSSKLELNCGACSFIYGTSFSSPRLRNSKKFEVNKNMVEAFLSIGKGHAAMETFSMILGTSSMDRKTFDKYVSQLVEEGKTMRDNVFEAARAKVREERKILDPFSNEIIDISVSYDGTWQKRGHNSLYSIGCVVDILTGLIIDFEVVSKYCHDCVKSAADLGKNTPEYSIWQDSHKKSGECEKNYEGSSGSMEAYAAEVLWKRSIEKANMRYTVMLSDGDSKTYNHLSKLKIYGDTDVLKEECINHASKRLGTALRNKIKEWRVKGVCLGGKKKGSLTEETINKLTNYYRKAIKENIPNVNKMKTAIFASLHHCMSTNDKPRHKSCPTGSDSWCFYNRAMASGNEVPDHNRMKTKLTEDIVSKILPVYQRLASNELLNRCTSGKTQNSNESVHSVIWKYCPKDTFVSKRRLELAATYAVSRFNMGCEATLSIKSDETVRSPSFAIAKKKDQRRLKQSLLRSTKNYKNERINKKYAKNKKERKLLQKEGPSYGAGSF